jgi:hypothetical protein
MEKENKKEYRSPVFTEYGTVGDMTKSGGAANFDASFES